MQRTPAATSTTQGASGQQFREQVEDDAEASVDATVSFEGSMNVSSDEDSGSDPYNRTGRFKRLVR